VTRHLRKLQKRFTIPLRPDADGYIGRECPEAECRKYFKIVNGTGLKNATECHCPYCGHTGDQGDFHTQAQVQFATSIVERAVQRAVTRDLQDMARDFNRRSSAGFLSIKMGVKSSPLPLRRYSERQLETHIECPNCTLKYAVYGVFAFCPDCRQHNSLYMLGKNLDVVGKMLDMAASADVEIAGKLVENALEDCVAAFDAFGRELCRVNANKASLPAKADKISFQNLEGAKRNVDDLFGFDISAGLTKDEWQSVVRSLQKRHLFVHRMGVVDEEYVKKTGDAQAVVGHKISLTGHEVGSAVQIVRKLAQYIAEKLAALPEDGTR